MNAAQGHVADHGGQGGSQQGHGSIFGKRFSLVFGVQPRAQNDGPDVETVFSKQREAGHQAHFHNGKAVERISGEFNDAHGEHGHNAGIDQSGACTGNINVVGNEQILHGDDPVETGQNVSRRIHNEPQDDQCEGKHNGGREDLFVA